MQRFNTKLYVLKVKFNRNSIDILIKNCTKNDSSISNSSNRRIHGLQIYSTTLYYSMILYHRAIILYYYQYISSCIHNYYIQETGHFR